MERFIQSFRILWRSERLLTEQQLRLGAQRVQFNALAALVGLSGFVMLTIAAFYALVPYWGHALAALTVGAADLVISGALVAYARSLRPPAEVEMIKEVHDMAVSDIKEEVSLVEAELETLKEDARRFLRNPVDALLPAAVGPLLSTLVRGLGSVKK
jgi:hypothetical protein